MRGLGLRLEEVLRASAGQLGPAPHQVSHHLHVLTARRVSVRSNGWKMPLKCHLSCECCRPQDTVSQSSTVSQCHTLASEVCDQSERGPSPKSRFSSSSPTQHHRDKRAFFWNRALVRLRNSFRSSNKIASESSLAPHQQNSSAQVNPACVRLSTTSTSVEEDCV